MTTPTLLESGLSLPELSRLSRAVGARDGIYGAHRWWARRPASTCRALLMAAFLPSDTPDAVFWKLYASSSEQLAGRVIGDPFVGGATSLVEARRLGASVRGVDVDPLAVLIADHELGGFDSSSVAVYGNELIRRLVSIAGDCYPPDADGTEPLHYFYLREVVCPGCSHRGLLYKSLVIARDTNVQGAVVRDTAITAFCPTCRRLKYLDASRTAFECCGQQHGLSDATYIRMRYQCPRCGARSSHRDLKTALAPRVCIALEGTPLKGHRTIREPGQRDLDGETRARTLLAAMDLPFPTGELPRNREDGRPQLYGVRVARDMFSARQLLVLGSAFAWVRDFVPQGEIQRALALVVSNALATNNLFCGYATDYGRLAPLFSVRSYALPALTVELNPFHSSGGRGTLGAMLRRVLKSNPPWRSADQPAHNDMATVRAVEVACRDAKDADWHEGSLDFVLTDPPYFDFIAYSDLSRFYRVWLESSGLIHAQAGIPLHAGKGDGEADRFASGLGAAFARALHALKPGGAMAFSYHSSSRVAWTAVADALLLAKADVTAAFPVWADLKSVGHGKDGNCEWDVYLVCRPANEVEVRVPVDPERWVDELGAFGISDADIRCWRLAAETVSRVRQEVAELDSRRTPRSNRHSEAAGGENGTKVGPGPVRGLRRLPRPHRPLDPERDQQEVCG